ncbi:O-antigen ligase family protein [Salipiger mangrovisoli]|uniref:O-antigen ligase family protein n=1 Tax=Salipiger mangrovisoli TaxID=2865933 RepID=A0ABR9X0Q5_9RHOB|nr:O-antigen ligase family protein [Salipiger mangrovisoli]MBE9637072.1 O-antigen ligase family protein [Salipiger mangrovisoli]
MALVEPHRPALSARRESADIWAFADVTLLFLVFFVSSDSFIQLGKIQSLTWMMCYAIALLRFGMLWPYFFPVLMRNKVLFIYPAVCIASVIWSFSKGSTLVASLQLTMSMMIGCYLGWRYSLTVIIKALTIVISISVFLSILHWATGIFPWPVYTRAGGLAGLYSHKNMLGQRALFAVIAIMAVWLMRSREAGTLFKVALIPTMFVTLFALVLSQSMTSVLLLPVLGGMLFVIGSRRIPSLVAFPSAVLGLIMFALVPVLLGLYGIDPVQSVLDAVGKSSSLTGRTTLWEVARGVSAQHPFFGVGYGAFWQAGEFAHERFMTQEAGATTSRSFHNFVFEILVGTGWPGLLAMIALLLAATKQLLRLYALRGSAAAAGGLVLMVGIIFTSLLGTTLFRGHEFMLILVVIFIVSGREEWTSGAAQGAHNRA